ncbi:hypothetical protein HPB48_009920 [Haemaphysalis longicornis]|uniref:Uncharacterized protein n=1 Tax=Haemaphysalis longicornis TaxID=44386 RepID=A0A9J6GT42_HAELO|nr:hypothetical protein HPB48_009920 [Haemaphysalis longicornis]
MNFSSPKEIQCAAKCPAEGPANISPPLTTPAAVGPILSTPSHINDPAVLVSHIAVASCRVRFLGYCLRKGLVPSEVNGLFGVVKPSLNHAKRVCRIIRSEVGRQLRMLHDLLRVACYVKGGDVMGESLLRSWRQQAAQCTEFLWRSTLVHLPRRHEKTAEAPHEPVVIGDVVVPEDVASVLRKGPKFCLEPGVPAHELLARYQQKSGEQDKQGAAGTVPLGGSRQPVVHYPEEASAAEKVTYRTSGALLQR